MIQDNWRWCHKCQGLYFAGNLSQGACPAGDTHENRGSGDYNLVQKPTSATGQDNWRFCRKCQGLHFAGNPSQGVCPFDGQAHVSDDSGNYVLVQNDRVADWQNNWRFCRKCQGLYFAGNQTDGVCPASGGHDRSGSGDYFYSSSCSRVSVVSPSNQKCYFWCPRGSGLPFQRDCM
jgi:hypothetical protein